VADAESGCLLRRDRPQSSPFRTVTRTYAAVDRFGESSDTHSLAGVEFEQGSGLWAVVKFASNDSEREWKDRLLAALRLLADTGFGGRRSSGWGQISSYRSQEGLWPGILLPKFGRAKPNGPTETTAEQGPAHWMLSLFRPGAEDQVDWSAGSYSLTLRGGHVESSAGLGASKRQARMIEEGSVIASPRPPVGSAVDVSPEGFPHPVYRSGFALCISLPPVNFGRPEEDEQAGGELAEALDEALKAAAEQEGQPSPDEQKIEQASEPESPAPGEESEPEVQPEKMPQIIAHTPVEQESPQTPFDEAPAPPAENELPERLNVSEPPQEQTDEPEMKKPETTEEEPGDEV
jgi:CRISPR Csm4 C-terminal domain